MAEQWKRIKNYPEYQISDQGRVWSNRSGKILRTHKGKVKLVYKTPITHTLSVKKLVDQHFGGNQDDR